MAGKTKRRTPAKTKPKARPARPSRSPKRAARRKPPAASKKAPPKASPKPAAKSKPSAAAKSAATPEAEVVIPRGDGRRHVLSLAFLRDGDEFLARLETDGGEITELKNRSLDQLLTLVANELEDLLE
jgi:hypothetical protein